MSEKKFTIVIAKGANHDHLKIQNIEDMLDGAGIRDYVTANYANEAINASEKGSCLLIIDSVVAGWQDGDGDEPDATARRVLAASKKNPGCKTLLFTSVPFSLGADDVDIFIINNGIEGYNKLETEVKKYAAQFN